MLELTCNKIAELVNGEPVGNTGLTINGINRSDMVKDNELTFLSDSKFLEELKPKKNIIVITSEKYADELMQDNCVIKVENPYLAFVAVLNHIDSLKLEPESGIHPSAVVEDNHQIHPEVVVYPNAYIGKNCKINKGVVIKPNAVIHDNVTIGENSIINANAVIYEACEIGNNCIIHSGAVIGADGFGYVEDRNTGKYTKIPQLGNVVLEDDVEIGANTTIDRAIAGSTIIRKGVKLDNLVQIAHNCIIGENTGIASQTGISGSNKIGARNRFGGQVGLAGHIETADDVIILAQSGIAKSIPDKGLYFGSPAKPHRRAFKIESVVRNLPELADEINTLKKEIEKLKNKE